MDKHVLDTIDPAIIGERLAEARRARRLTQQDAAESLGVARTTVVAMEKGVRRPRAGELVHLARLYGRQVSDFVRGVPARPRGDFVVQFRAARGPSDVIPEPDRTADSLRFEELCRSYVELEELLHAPLPRRYPTSYDVSGTPPEAAGAEVAAAERLRLGLGDGPISDPWGLLAAEVGIRIFAFPFESKRIAGMFVFNEDYGGCIAVNANHPEEKRRWTLIHDYGHFLTSRLHPALTLSSENRRLPEAERVAESFTRHFLLPTNGVTRQFQAVRRSKDGPITPGDLLGLAHHFGVSFQAMCWRLEQLDLIDSGTWERLKALGLKTNQARAIVGIPDLSIGHSMLPLRYEVLAVEAYEADLLTTSELAAYLQTDVVGARRRIDELTGTWFIDDGESRRRSINLARPLAGSRS